MVTKNFTTISLMLLAAPVLAAVPVVPVPDYAVPNQGQQVILNVPQLRLFLFQDGQLIKSYPMTVGKASTPTPLGEFKIGAKAYKPTWSVPKSIQKEMADSGKPVQTQVAAGPNNPLGPVFVRLGPANLGIGIHGTNAPSSVPGVRSHGCVRLQSPNALDFAKVVQSGAAAAVIYQQASVNVDDDHQVWIQTYANPYRKKSLDKAQISQSVQSWAQNHTLKLNHKRLATALSRPGTLVCVTCDNSKTKIKGRLHSLAWTSGEGELVQLKTVLPELPDAEAASMPTTEGNSVEVNEDFNDAPATLEKDVKPLPTKPQQQPDSANDHLDSLL